MDYSKCPGRCLIFLCLALIFDTAGLVIFVLGIFAQFSFSEFFVFSGPIIIFLSLVFWIFWYLGNIMVSDEELLLPKRGLLIKFTLCVQEGSDSIEEQTCWKRCSLPLCANV
ncbi:hypothetical protein GN956_G8350 [Arapaima gigas]